MNLAMLVLAKPCKPGNEVDYDTPGRRDVDRSLLNESIGRW
jgi:hypothetical protein